MTTDTRYKTRTKSILNVKKIIKGYVIVIHYKQEDSILKSYYCQASLILLVLGENITYMSLKLLYPLSVTKLQNTCVTLNRCGNDL